MNSTLQAEVSQRALRQVVVLIVDDEAAVRRAMARMLCQLGFQVVEADCGEQALQQLRENRAIRVVLLDQSMPQGSGASYARRLRAANPAARLVFHTAQPVNEEDRALVDDVIHKPADMTELVRLLDHWAEAASQHAVQASP